MSRAREVRHGGEVRDPKSEARPDLTPPRTA